MSNDTFKSVSQIVTGYVFHRPLNDTTVELKFINKRWQETFLHVFKMKNIEIKKAED
jgi:hypothetical protein